MQISKKVASLEPSLTLAVSAKAKKMRQEGKKVINFSAGEPDFNTPDAAQEAAIKAIHENYTRYTPVAGDRDLVEAVCAKFKERSNLDYSPS